MQTYDTCNMDDRRVHTKGLVDDGVEVGKTVCKLIICWVYLILKKLVSQLCLHVRVARQFQQGPLGNRSVDAWEMHGDDLHSSSLHMYELG